MTGVAVTPGAGPANWVLAGCGLRLGVVQEVRPMDRRPGPSGIVLLAIAGLACTGNISGNAPSDSPPGSKPPAGNGMGTPTGGKGGNTAPPPMGPNAPGASPLRRLTIREYNNTLRDLLGIAPGNRDLGVDQDAGGFAIGGPVTTSGDAARLLDTAEQLAAGAAAKITTLVPCSPVPADAAGQM